MPGDDWLEIIDLTKLINFSRKVIYSNIGEEHTDLSNMEFLKAIENMQENNLKELDSILPIIEAKAIFEPYLKKERNKKTFKTRISIKESDYDEVLQQLGQRMISNIVRNLVKKGLVESAFDEEKNDFVFWLKKEIGE